MTRFLLWFVALGILALIALILYTPSTFAGDLVVTWTTQPGDQKPKEVAIFGDPAKGPDDPKAVKFLVDQASASTLVKEAKSNSNNNNSSPPNATPKLVDPSASVDFGFSQHFDVIGFESLQEFTIHL